MIKAEKVALQNMAIASNELRTLMKCKKEEVASVATSFDCSWNSRGWQAKQGVVAAIAQENGKIIDVVHKNSFCRECKVKQESRDKKEISSLNYLEWYVNHEESCFLNHTGSSQVKLIITNYIIFLTILTEFNRCILKLTILSKRQFSKCFKMIIIIYKK